MIKQYVPQDFCMSCKGCCRFAACDSAWTPYITTEDRGRLERNKTPSLFISNQNRIRLIYNQQCGAYVCAFLGSQENKCKVYEYRPLDCQIYPFLIHRNGQNIFLALDKKCPYVRDNGHGPVFDEYVSYLLKECESSRFTSLLRAHPQLAQAYDDIVSIAELKM